jgi:hypothetical protein
VDIPIRFSPTVRVSGVVVGPDGPVEHLTVRLLPPTAADPDYFEPAGVSSAVTGRGGTFTVVAVAPGTYTVNSALMVQATQTAPDVSLWMSQPITIGQADVTGLTLTLTPGIRVSGRVAFKGGAAPAGTPMERMSVILRPIGAEGWRTLPGFIGPDGSFTTPGDPPGRYEVGAYVPGGWSLIAVSRAGTPVPDRVIELAREDVTDLVLTFSRTPTRLSGSITDAKGAPDPDTDVVVFPADTMLWREGIFDSRRVRRIRATAAAMFDLSGLSPGDYHVVAVSTRLTTDWEDPLFLETLIPGASKVTLDDGAHRVVTLRTFAPRGR